MNILNWNLVSCLVSIGFQEVLILKNKKVGKVIIVAFIPSNVGSFVIAEILNIYVIVRIFRLRIKRRSWNVVCFIIHRCGRNHNYTACRQNSHICFECTLAPGMILLSIFDVFGSYNIIFTSSYEISLSYRLMINQLWIWVSYSLHSLSHMLISYGKHLTAVLQFTSNQIRATYEVIMARR